MKVTEKYVFFYANTCFSQWHPSKFTVDGRTYNCAEQYMMAEKARLFEDKESENKIMKADHPSKQKELGRKVKNFDEKIWNQHAKDIVYVGNKAKFTQNKDFLESLMNTGDRILVEASPYDKIWGIGLNTHDKHCLNPETWQGTNWLGQVLTKLRDDLRKK